MTIHIRFYTNTRKAKPVINCTAYNGDGETHHSLDGIQVPENCLYHSPIGPNND
jgi:hypothetical protein